MQRTPSLIRKLNLIDILLEDCECAGVVVEEPSEDEVKEWTEERIREYFTKSSQNGGVAIPQNKTTFPPPTNEDFTKWFPGLQRSGTLSKTPKGVVLCFHNAGNAEDMYTSEGTGARRIASPLLEWCRVREFECLAPQLPGRAMRTGESMISEAKAAAKAIFNICAYKFNERPYCIIAHSMGCWVAYEFLIHARARGCKMPHVAFLSGMPSPDIEFKRRPWRQQHLLDVENFKSECRAWDINEVVFNGEMWTRFEPLLRSDFTIFDSYQWRHNNEPPFAFPIHAFWGTQDKRVTQELVKGWENFTTGGFEYQAINGNHLWPLNPQVKTEWLNKLVQKLNRNDFK